MATTYELSGPLTRQQLWDFLGFSTLSASELQNVLSADQVDGSLDQFTNTDFATLPQSIQEKLFENRQKFILSLPENFSILRTRSGPDGAASIVADIMIANTFGVFKVLGSAVGGGCADPKLIPVKNPDICIVSKEICDGIDNNCNGEIDERLLNACGTCGPAPQEICDGIDNNCDSQTDEGVLNPCGTCDDDCKLLTTSLNGDSSLYPSVVWAGRDFGIAWVTQDHNRENSKIHFAILDARGHKIPNSEIEIAEGNYPHLAWNGSIYGITWFNHDSQYFARISSQGQKLGDDVTLASGNAVIYPSSDGAGAAIASDGMNFGIAWEANDKQLHFSNIDTSGHFLVADHPVETGFSQVYGPNLIWADNQYGLSFVRVEPIGNGRNTTGAIYFINLNEEGDTKINPGNDQIRPIRIGDGELFGANHFRASMGWLQGAERYGIAWVYDYLGERSLLFNNLASNGVPLTLARSLLNDSNAGNISMAAGTEGYYVVWPEFRGRGLEIYLRKLDFAGNPSGAEALIATDGAMSPILVSASDVYGLAWTGFETGRSEIYFSIIP